MRMHLTCSLIIFLLFVWLWWNLSFSNRSEIWSLKFSVHSNLRLNNFSNFQCFSLNQIVSFSFNLYIFLASYCKMVLLRIVQPKCSKLSQFYLTSSQALDISFQLVVWAINCWYNRRFLRGLSIKHWKIFFCWHIFSMVLTISKGNVGQYSLFKICISIFRKQCQIKEIFEQILSFQSFLIVLEVY